MPNDIVHKANLSRLAARESHANWATGLSNPDAHAKIKAA